MHESQLRAIYDRTSGHCHFCGDPVAFEKRGWSDDPDGYWEVTMSSSAGRAVRSRRTTASPPARAATGCVGTGPASRCESFSFSA